MRRQKQVWQDTDLVWYLATWWEKKHGGKRHFLKNRQLSTDETAS